MFSAVQCSSVSIINGNVTSSFDGQHTIAVYTCEPGFALSGMHFLFCDSNGSWVGDTPECGMAIFFSLDNLNEEYDDFLIYHPLHNCRKGHFILSINKAVFYHQTGGKAFVINVVHNKFFKEQFIFSFDMVQRKAKLDE